MTMPSAGSRPAGTSQKLLTVFTPMPMSDGHFTSGVTVLVAAAAGFDGAFFAGALCRCAAAGPARARSAANTAVARVIDERRMTLSIAFEVRGSRVEGRGSRVEGRGSRRDAR